MTDQNEAQNDVQAMRVLAERAAAQQARNTRATTDEQPDLQEAFNILGARAEAIRVRNAQKARAQAEAEREQAAAEKAERDAWAARMKALTEREDAQIRARRSTLPDIPKVGSVAGMRNPAFNDFLFEAQAQRFTIRDIPGYEEMNLPEEPTEVQVLAYGLLPAFYWQYSDYLAANPALTPTLLVKAWLNAMGVDSKGDFKTQRYIEPHELRYAIHNTAKGNYPMNPKAMQQAGIKGRENTKVDYTAYREHYYSIKSGQYVFSPSVLLPSTHIGASTDWVSQTEYPYRFAFTNLKPQHLAFINLVIQHRISAEQDFSPAMGRWLTEQLLIIMGWFMNEGRPLTQAQVFEAAWRFPLSMLNDRFGAGSYYGKNKTDRPDAENFDRSLLPPLPIVESHQPDSAKHPDAE